MVLWDTIAIEGNKVLGYMVTDRNITIKHQYYNLQHWLRSSALATHYKTLPHSDGLSHKVAQ